MKDTEKADGLRAEYIVALKEVAGLAVDRASHLPGDTGSYHAMRSPQESEESIKIVEKVTKLLADGCNKMRAIEQRAKGSIGIPALFGLDVANSIRAAVAILASKALSDAWHHETRSVGILLPSAGGSDPHELITVREAFRKNGLLRPYIHCETGRTLDEFGNLTLKETSFRTLLNLEPDSECDDLIMARQLVAVSSKR